MLGDNMQHVVFNSKDSNREVVRDPQGPEQKPKEKAQSPPPCKTFAADTAARSTIAAYQNATDAAGIASESARLALVARSVITGRISYVGFDGVPRSFAADTGAQAKYMLNHEGGAFGVLRTTGNLFAVYGAANGLANIQAGYQSGNSDQAFDGSMQLLATGIGVLNPVAGVAMGLTLLGDNLLSTPKPSVLDSLTCTPVSQ